MSSILEKALSILELMADHPEGMQVSAIAEQVEQPVSGVHRQLREFERLHYVRQLQSQGAYTLTIKLAALGLGFLGRSGVTDIAQPILDRLAKTSKELIRLSVLDENRLVWVAVAQGATSGLRYDPGREQGVVVHLASSAGGLAFLSALSDEEALTWVTKQGLRPTEFEPGSKAPKTIAELQKLLKETRKRGYSIAVDSYMEGMAAMAVPVRDPETGAVLGCLSIAGPAVRLGPKEMAGFAGDLQAAADELGQAASASGYLSAIKRQAESVGAKG